MTREKIIAKTKAGLCKIGGFVFFSLGFVGIFLPLLPTTIFWIMAVWLYSKAHPEMIVKIYAWPSVGQIVQDFVEKGAISPRNKRVASFGIIAVGGLSIWATDLSLVWTLGFVALFAATLFYIWSRPTK